ncbi:MAG: TetR/AcrR family transcriptional regulator [Treponema sp.]|jgi:AcrR family transcriptional regulator|nr:TetR/AcrR family transcriptional regulator [Treponema sp.]
MNGRSEYQYMGLITRDDIIKAAFRVWGRELYLATSLNDLAKELKVSKAALYRHFRNKEAILDAMYEYFFDDHIAFIRDGYERALGAPDFLESAVILTRVIVEYYLRNVDSFIFSLMRVYGSRKIEAAGEALRRRGVDMSRFRPRNEPASDYPSLFQMLTATLTFWVAIFHNRGQTSKGAWTEKSPAEAEIRAMIGVVEEKIIRGLGLQKELLDTLDYEALEQNIPRSQLSAFKDGDLLKAVAETVAAAGPWNVSLDMIARRSGLSKSGLYAHFRSKQDMLRSFFLTEFERMIRYAQGGMAASEAPPEQFYLALVSLADYLRSRPEILMAVDWLRTRRLDLELEIPVRLYRIFSGISLPGAEPVSVPGGGGESGPETEYVSQWILFLIVNTLIQRPPGMDFSEVPNAGIRRLYRFVCLGLKGFET